MNLKLTAIAAALLLVFAVSSPTAAYASAAQEDVTPLSKAAILYEETSDTVIYDKNKDMQLTPATQSFDIITYSFPKEKYQSNVNHIQQTSS